MARLKNDCNRKGENIDPLHLGYGSVITFSIEYLLSLRMSAGTIISDDGEGVY